MAAADYKSCDNCGRKTFYDTELDYGQRGDSPVPTGAGDWAVICPECAKTMICMVRDRKEHDPLFDVAPDPANRPVGGEALREALENAEAAIAEFYRYQTGGETRGSYDGEPERQGLWTAMYVARAALATVAPPATPALEAGGEKALRWKSTLEDIVAIMAPGSYVGLLARNALTSPRGPDQSGGVALEAREDGR